MMESIWLRDEHSPPDMSRSSSSRNDCSPGLGTWLSGALWSRGSVTLCGPSPCSLAVIRNAITDDRQVRISHLRWMHKVRQGAVRHDSANQSTTAYLRCVDWFRERGRCLHTRRSDDRWNLRN